MTALEFTGPRLLAAALAVVGAAVAIALYRRDRAATPSGRGWPLLPALRAAALALTAFMLAGPVLRHRRAIGEPLHVRVVLDHSASMGMTDAGMEAGRKLLIAHRLGWTEAAGLDAALLRAADDLAEAAGAAIDVAESGSAAAAAAVAARVESAARHLASASAGALAGLRQVGSADLERWTGIGGDRVDDLVRSERYRGPPHQRRRLTALSVPDDGADNFGERIRGYLLPPATGDYIFWITGDDGAELWLSNGENPALRSRIAAVEGWTPPEQWEQTPSQKSRRLRLEAGRRYYFDVLHKEGYGQAHVAVRWQLPDGTIESPVPGIRMMPFEAGEGFDAMAAFSADALDPARRLAEGSAGDAAAVRREAAALARRLGIWERELRHAFLRGADAVANSDRPAIRAVLDRFDRASRWERVVGQLWQGRSLLLADLAGAHELRVFTLSEGRLEEVWQSRPGAAASAEPPPPLRAPPGGRFTDLSAALAGLAEPRRGEADDSAPTGPRSAVLLISDGRHNHGPTPIETARVLGERGVPVIAVAVGDDRPPRDVALVSVNAPASAFHTDRVRGALVLADHLEPGRPLTLRVRCGDRQVWEKTETSTGEGTRRFVFDLPLEELSEEQARRLPSQVDRPGARLDFEASVEPAGSDAVDENNRRAFSVFAVTRRYKVLLIDGRPRWETRYVRNLFERDEKWAVTSVDASADLPRGEGRDRFPAGREDLFGFDLVILGEVPRDRFRAVDLEWLRDFVGDRGGGLILLDGERGHLRSHADGPLGVLRPADWIADRAVILPEALRLTVEGARGLALELSSDGRPVDSAWRDLPPPRRVEAIRPRPGSEVWMEADGRRGEVSPAMAVRRYGAGRVVHLALDEAWRWRRETADALHARFWNQLAMETMESPYAVSGRRLSLDVGPPVQPVGARAHVRVRLRDDRGRAVSGAVAQAHLFRDGRRVAVLPLAPDERGGAYRAETEPLTPGEYEVRVTVAGVPDSDLSARGTFSVRPPAAGEMAELACDEALLRQVASVSRGRFFREENLAEAAAALRPLSRGRVVESETLLWQQWPWFLTVVALLTIEWILRKRTGLL